MSAPRINLNVLDVPNPCSVSWESMTGDDRVRFCGQCQKSVYHLSSMTRDEAKEIVALSEGNLCVQFWRRADGTVVTQDCAVVRVAKKAGNALGLVVMSVLAVVLFFLTWRRLDWFTPASNQTFSMVGGGFEAGDFRGAFARPRAHRTDVLPPPRLVPEPDSENEREP